MTARRFQQVDVFTSEVLGGNPVAVVLDADGLDTTTMQRFTDWTNLSEATFVLPPTDDARSAGADYRVRIFCPGRELPFAGHPTLGTCHAWLRAGGRPRRDDVVVQECGVGLVTIRRDADRLAFAAPPLRRSGPLDTTDLERLLAGLGLDTDDVIDHSWCDNGPGWQALLLRSAEAVLGVRPDPAVLAGLDVGLIGAHAEPGRDPDDPAFAHDPMFEVRAFFPGNSGLTEDPVTGSLNAALAQWLIGSGRAPDRYLAAQGTVLGRTGRVHIERDDRGAVWVGGDSVTCIDGTVALGHR